MGSRLARRRGAAVGDAVSGLGVVLALRGRSPINADARRRLRDYAVMAVVYGLIPWLTISYGEIATKLGDRLLARDVGQALGKNPFPIIVPCHRVVGSNGSLTGYGGGLERKRWLLEHEARYAGAGQFQLECTG